MDTDKLKTEPEPWEFRAKPVWQRLIVMVGGVTMNVILGVFIFAMLKYTHGDARTPMSALKDGIHVPAGLSAESIGFRTGDVVVSVNGEPVQYFEDAAGPAALLGTGVYYEVMRDGQKVRIDVPDDLIRAFADKAQRETALFLPRVPAVARIAPGTVAAGYKNAQGQSLQDDDRILSVDGKPTPFYDQLKDAMTDKAGKTVHITALRGQDTLRFSPTLDKTGLLGLAPALDLLPREQRRYGFWESFPVGTVAAFRVLTDNIRGMGKVIRGDVDPTRTLEGPVGIAKRYHEVVSTSGLYGFWLLTGVLSMWLAFINILPIPALDGGHVVFLLLEAVMRREPSLKLRMIAQQVGMILLLTLMALVLLNDFLT